jgi:hypothetical protein
MNNVAERLGTLESDVVVQLAAALDAFAEARSQALQATFLAGGGEMVTTLAAVRAEAEESAAADRVARLVLQAITEG